MKGIQYQIILRAGDGNEFGPFSIRDHYFNRDWKTIGREVLDCIKEHDKTYEERKDGKSKTG